MRPWWRVGEIEGEGVSLGKFGVRLRDDWGDEYGCVWGLDVLGGVNVFGVFGLGSWCAERLVGVR